MKTLYFYLQAKIKGNTLSWTQAKAEAERVSVLDYIEESLDLFFLRLVSLFNFLRNLFITKVMFNIDLLLNWAYKHLVASFFGRVLICFTRGHTDYHFLFKGRVKTP